MLTLSRETLTKFQTADTTETMLTCDRLINLTPKNYSPNEETVISGLE